MFWLILFLSKLFSLDLSGIFLFYASFCSYKRIDFDPKVEKIARRTRKETKQLREEQSSVASQSLDPEVESTDSSGGNSSDPSQEDIPMTNARTLRELAAPEMTQQPCALHFQL